RHRRARARAAARRRGGRGSERGGFDTDVAGSEQGIGCSCPLLAARCYPIPVNLLVVDVGNTNIVLGIYRGDELATSWRLATMRERTADEYGILVRQLIGAEWKLEGAIVSSVVPPLNGTVAGMIEKFFGIEPMFVEPGVKT